MKSRLALSVKEFCEQTGMGNTLFYKLQKTEEGPILMRVGGRVMIAHDTALAWIRSREGIAAPARQRAPSEPAAVTDRAPAASAKIGSRAKRGATPKASDAQAQQQVSAVTKQGEGAAYQPVSSGASITTESSLASPARLNAYRSVGPQDLSGIRRRREPR
jgi:predicted DNA-binding transcriptional regulator AlpA